MSLSLPAVPPFQEVGSLAVSDQSKWIQQPLTVLKQARRVPIERWGLYIGILLFCIWISSAFFFLQLSHVIFIGIAIMVVYFLHNDFEVSQQTEYQSIMTMWKSLPGLTSALYLDANLIIFLYEYRRMAETHETGWQESIRQINQLLRLSWESQYIRHDKEGHFALIQQCYDKALFHFHSIVFAQSEYHTKYLMWKKAMTDLQQLLWVHVQESRERLGLSDQFQVNPNPIPATKSSSDSLSRMIWNAS